MAETADLLDVEEAGRFLHLKATTVRAWIIQRRIPYVKLGQRVFLKRQVLEEVIEKGVVMPNGAEIKKRRK